MAITKEAPSHIIQPSTGNIVHLNVSGRHFDVEREILATAVESPLSVIASDRWAGPDHRSFVAVNPDAFTHVLSFLRHNLKLPAGLSKAELSTIKRDNQHALHIPELEQEIAHWYPLRAAKKDGDLLATMRYAERKALTGDLHAALDTWSSAYNDLRETDQKWVLKTLAQSCGPTWASACRIASDHGTANDLRKMAADNKLDMTFCEKYEGSMSLVFDGLSFSGCTALYKELCAGTPHLSSLLFGSYAWSAESRGIFSPPLDALMPSLEKVEIESLTNRGGSYAISITGRNGSWGRATKIARLLFPTAKMNRGFPALAHQAINALLHDTPEESLEEARQMLQDDRLRDSNGNLISEKLKQDAREVSAALSKRKGA